MIFITWRYFILNIRHIIKIILIFWLIKLFYRIAKSDKVLNSIELIEAWGYPVEQHNVTTEDGYILNIFRIPWSPLDLSNKSGQKPPIIFLSGVATSSDAWVFTMPNRSLAKQLVDEGYDVWLGNFRGSTYGRAHVTLSPNDKKFWDFSFHEIGYYDVPSMIEYILNTTNQTSLTCVGLSMGTTTIFVTLSERPEYNSKVQLVIAFGAIAGFVNKHFIDMRMITFFQSTINFIDSTGTFEMLPQNPIRSKIFKEICANNIIIDFCLTPLDIFCGKDRDQFDINVFIKLMDHFPAGTSGKLLLHYAQMAQYNSFQQYDYENKSENLRRYNKSKPPKYNFKNMKSPMLIFYAMENDPLSTFADVTEIIKSVSSKVIAEPVPYKNFNHIDFISANDVKKLLNNRVVERLGQFMKEKILF